MRVKGFLAARGVEFDPIDVTSDPTALTDLQARGIRGLPVVTRGDRYVLGFDLAQVEAFVGLTPSATLEFSGQELAERAVRILTAALRYARQLPASRYADPCPGMENVKPPFVVPGGHVLVLSDGTPFVPHDTFLGLFRHIITHGVKFRHEFQDPHEEYPHAGLYAQFGEPLPSLTLDELAALVGSIVRDIDIWWKDTGGRDLSVVRETFIGPQTLRQMLQRETYAMAQHTRQLMDVLQRAGIEPDHPIGEREYAGLSLPPGVWD